MAGSDLFLAILAMDSYNRGYNAALDLGTSTQIGTASIISSYGGDAAGAAAFYGVEYQLSNGQVVIAYRGTDQNRIGTMALNAYPVAVRLPETTQSEMAAEFFEPLEIAPGLRPLTGRSSRL